MLFRSPIQSDISEQLQHVEGRHLREQLPITDRVLDILLLDLLHVVEEFVDRVFDQDPCEGGFLVLADAKDAAEGLIFGATVKPQVHEDYAGG